MIMIVHSLHRKPYDEVHLIDSRNLARQHTDNMNDVYSMIADTLFEDFRSADFANRKRSIVVVNQRQHKRGLRHLFHRSFSGI